MPPLTALLVMGPIAYLIGAIPFGFVVARARGIDIRQHGSGNIGATNVGRVLGRPWGILVLVLDAAKALLVMTVARYLSSYNGYEFPGVTASWILMAAGVCVILGNVFPVYLKFKGGKAVATSIGVLISVWPDLGIPAVIALVLWLVTVKATRYVSLASLIAAVAHPIAMVICVYTMRGNLAETYPLLILSGALATIIIIRHRANIQRLLAGTETKVGVRGGTPNA